jgi:hypothetical protein
MGIKKSQLVSSQEIHPLREGPPRPVIRGEPAMKRLRSAFGCGGSERSGAVV